MTSKGEYALNSSLYFYRYISTSHFIPLHRVREGAAVQQFTFVLTDLEGCQRFGFCRLTNNTNTCLCILRYVCVRGGGGRPMPSNIVMKTLFLINLNYSYLPWFEVFYKLLNNLADYLTKGQVRFPVCVLSTHTHTHTHTHYCPSLIAHET